MKLFTVLMLAFVWGASASSFSQKQVVTLDLNQCSINELFKEIRKQTGLQFVYNEEYVKELPRMNLQVDKKTVGEVLERIFKETPYQCVFEESVIYVTKAQRSGETNQTNKITVKGKVTDETGTPLPGVSVMVEGTTTGVATGINGDYEMMIGDNPNLILKFSFIGMKPHTEKIGVRKVINVQLTPESVSMDEVMVVAYGTTKKEAFTGSAVSVKGDKIMKEAAGAISPEKALKGYVAGVRVSRGGGQPGESSDLQIRGIGSISQSTSPLYVIDGIPTNSNQLNNINPNDIESMTVLKDAAATSLYGSRASAGVIVITTRKGKEGKTLFDITYERGFSSETTPHQLNGYYMDGQELANYSIEALKNNYLYTKKALPGMSQDNLYQTLTGEAMNYALRNLNSVGKITHPDDQLDGKFDYNNMTDAQLQKYLTGVRTYNWYDAIFKNGSEDKVNFSARGGSKTTNFFTSLGYVRQSGITQESDFHRISGRISIENQAAKFLKLSFIQSLAYTKQSNKVDAQGATAENPIASLGGMNPTLPVYGSNGKPYPRPGFNPNTTNFLEAVSLDQNKFERLSTISNVSATVDFTSWLKFTTVNGLDIRYYKDLQVWNPDSEQGSTTKGLIDESRGLGMNIVTSNILNFNKELNKHTIGALAGYEAKWTRNDWLEAKKENFPVSKLMQVSNGSLATASYGDLSNDRLISWIFKADYNYDNKYLFTASYRRDGTSRLLPANRWGNFWSTSAAWNITRENFMASTSNWLDNLRFKVSYGTNGTQPSDYFSSLTLFAIDGIYDSRPAVSPNSFGNPNITWETSYTWNTGIDFAMFNNRLRGTLEYYNKLTTDLINSRPVSYTTGWSSVLVNEGKLRNTGVELTLDSRNIEKAGFTWETNFNISYMKAIVEEMEEEKESGSYMYRAGEPLYSFYVREYTGVDPATGRSQWRKNTKGDDGVSIVDRSITTDVNEAEKVITKKGYPDFFGGLTNRFTYKGFDLSFLLTFTIGGTLFDSQYTYTVKDGKGLGGANARFDAYKNAWKKPGDKAETPIIIYTDPFNSNYTSTRSMQSSDHLKIKNISFGYTVPEQWTKSKLGLSTLRIYVNGNDIYTFYKDDYINPEVNNSGSYNEYSYPSLRSWRLGVSVQF